MTGQASGLAGGGVAVADGGYLLAIDSSTAHGSVAVGTRDGVLAEISMSVRATHSSSLLPGVDHVLGRAGIGPSDIGAVVVGAGPGSFTGIRIAAATAKGIGHALGTPCFAYSSLLLLAAGACGGTGTVCAILDARGRDVFAALYRFGAELRTTMEPTATTIDEMIDHLRQLDGVRVVGDGATRHQAEIEAETKAHVVPPHLGSPRAAALIWLATTWPAAGKVDDLGTWEPTYLRASGAERIAAQRAKGIA